MSGRERALLGFCLSGLVLSPLCWMFVQAFSARESEAVLAIWNRADVQDLLATSIFLALTTTAFALLLAVPLGLCLYARKGRIARVLRAIHWLPLLIPPHIHTIAWARILGDRGVLTLWLKEKFNTSFNVRAPLGDPLSGDLLSHIYLGPAWVMACSFFPLVTLAVLAGLEARDADGVDAARLVASKRRRFFTLLLPEIAPHLAAGGIFVFVLSLTTYPVVSLLDTPTLIQKVFFTFSQVDQGAGALLALPLIATTLVCVVVLSAAEGRLELRGRKRPLSLRADATHLQDLIAALILLVSFGVPFAALLREAGPLHGRGDNYQSVFARVDQAFVDSLLVSLLAVFGLLILGTALGRALARGRSRFLEGLMLSGVAMPPMIVAVALTLFAAAAQQQFSPAALALAGLTLILVLTRKAGGLRSRFREVAVPFLLAAAAIAVLWVPGLWVSHWIYTRGCILHVLALVILFLPFTARLMRNGFRQTDPDQSAAARLSPRSRLVRLLRIDLPTVKGSLIASGLVAYVLCFTELSASLLVMRPGWQSVQVRIFNMVHYRSIGEVCALCVLVVLLAALPVILATLLSPARRSSA